MNSRHHTSTNYYAEAPVLKPGAEIVGSSVLGVARFSSHAIFAGGYEVEIEHNGVLYRLRQTSLGKLILTK